MEKKGALRRPFSFHDLQTRPPRRTWRLRWRVVAVRYRLLARLFHFEHHPLAVLARIDGHDRARGQIEAVRYPAETALEADAIVIHVQVEIGRASCRERV